MEQGHISRRKPASPPPPATAGVLLDLAALHWGAEGVRVRFSSGKRTVIDGPFGKARAIVPGYWILQVIFELEEFGESPAVERGRQLETELPKNKA